MAGDHSDKGSIKVSGNLPAEIEAPSRRNFLRAGLAGSAALAAGQSLRGLLRARVLLPKFRIGTGIQERALTLRLTVHQSNSKVTWFDGMFHG